MLSFNRKASAVAGQATDVELLGESRRGDWVPTVCAVLAVWASILFVFRRQVSMMLEAWDTLPSHEHGHVVLVVVLYLLWIKRAPLLNTACTPSWKGFVALLATSGLAMLGEMVSVAAAVQFSIVLMMIAAIWAVAGDKMLRVAIGPMIFMLFAVPFGQEIVPVLMTWTADATVAALRYSGVPVYQEGRNFVIPSGRWSVVEACGGIRYLLTSIFIGAVFAYLTYTRTYKRVLFMLWAIVMPLFANWVRAYVIVMVAHFTANEWGLGHSHIALGWVIFGIAIFASFAVGVRWRDPAPAFVASRSNAAPVVAILVAGVLASGIPFGWHFLERSLDSAATTADPVLRMDSLAALSRDDAEHEGIHPTFPGARVVHQSTYAFNGAPVDVYIAYYRNQTQGAELVNVENRLEPTKDWGWAVSSRAGGDRPELPALAFEGFVKKSQHAAVYHFYWVNGMTTTSDFYSKILEAVSRLRGRGDDAAAVAITAYSGESVELARKQVEAFSVAHLQGILADLDRVATEKGK